jgi:hypothetical protein
MDLEIARRNIQACVDRMRILYTKPVFDEWVILGLGGKHGAVLAYSGPRAETFRKQLTDDVELLRAQTTNRSLAVGDFEFVAEATGHQHDALMKMGPVTYLVCNHTTKTMTEIRAEARWLKAQAVYFELSEKFRADPFGE